MARRNSKKTSPNRKAIRKKPARRYSAGLRPKLVRYGLKLVIGLIVLSLIQVIALRFIDPPITVAVVWDYAAHRLSGTPYQRPRFIWQPLGHISPHLQRAVLAAEDQRFGRHRGFDLVEIKATVGDLISKGSLRGASTITMQTARTVYLLPVRSILRKMLEAYYTVLIELFWDKRRILEVYLNTVDWGTGIMGAEAAARNYFNQSAAHVSRRQAALLAAVLPNPHRFSPTRPTKYLHKRARRITTDMPHMPVF